MKPIRLSNQGGMEAVFIHMEWIIVFIYGLSLRTTLSLLLLVNGILIIQIFHRTSHWSIVSIYHHVNWTGGARSDAFASENGGEISQKSTFLVKFLGVVQGRSCTTCILQIKFYWITARPICLCIIVHGCFHVTMAKLSSCNRDCWPIKPKIFVLWPYNRKSLMIPILGHSRTFLPK